MKNMVVVPSSSEVQQHQCHPETLKLMLQAKSLCLQHEIETQQIQILRDVVTQRRITFVEIIIQTMLSCLFAPAVVKFITNPTLGIIGDATKGSTSILDSGLNFVFDSFDKLMGYDETVIKTKLFGYFGDYIEDKIFWQEIWTITVAFVLSFLVIHVVFAFAIRLRYDNLYGTVAQMKKN